MFLFVISICQFELHLYFLWKTNLLSMKLVCPSSWISHFQIVHRKKWTKLKFRGQILIFLCFHKWNCNLVLSASSLLFCCITVLHMWMVCWHLANGFCSIAKLTWCQIFWSVFITKSGKSSQLPPPEVTALQIEGKMMQDSSYVEANNGSFRSHHNYKRHDLKSLCCNFVSILYNSSLGFSGYISQT